MSDIIGQYASIEETILKALNGYIEGEAAKILETHKKAITKELDEATRRHIADVALTISRMASVERLGSDIRITIHDARKP